MRICHVVPSLEDRHGGPSRSVRALADAAARLEPGTVLLATHATGQPLAPACSVGADTILFDREAPRWLCRSRGLHQHLQDTAYDCVHAHGLWLLTLAYARDGARRHDTPFVIAPRGMMSGWAYRHRRWKKLLAEWFVHPGSFAAARGWHATSPEEADDIRRLGHAQPICVAPNGVTIPAADELASARRFWLERCPALAGRRVALFYSRLHRKKRVRELVDCWAKISAPDWFLLIVGTPEEFTPEEIGVWIRAAGLEQRAAAFSGAGVPAPFGAADLLLFPSHSENFGLVVAESLAAGVPVLATDQTPWRGLDTHDAGRCVAWEDWPAALRTLLAESPESLTARGQRGREWTEREFNWTRAAALLSDFYRTLHHA